MEKRDDCKILMEKSQDRNQHGRNWYRCKDTIEFGFYRKRMGAYEMGTCSG
jgi:hypothetical protein